MIWIVIAAWMFGLLLGSAMTAWAYERNAGSRDWDDEPGSEDEFTIRQTFDF